MMKTIQVIATKLSQLVDSMPLTSEGLAEAVLIAKELEVLRRAIFITNKYNQDE